MFRYYNMDAALRSGIDTAESILRAPARSGTVEPVLAHMLS